MPRCDAAYLLRLDRDGGMPAPGERRPGTAKAAWPKQPPQRFPQRHAKGSGLQRAGLTFPGLFVSLRNWPVGARPGGVENGKQGRTVESVTGNVVRPLSSGFSVDLAALNQWFALLPKHLGVALYSQPAADKNNTPHTGVDGHGNQAEQRQNYPHRNAQGPHRPKDAVAAGRPAAAGDRGGRLQHLPASHARRLHRHADRQRHQRHERQPVGGDDGLRRRLCRRRELLQDAQRGQGRVGVRVLRARPPGPGRRAPSDARSSSSRATWCR